MHHCLWYATTPYVASYTNTLPLKDSEVVECKYFLSYMVLAQTLGFFFQERSAVLNNKQYFPL